GGAGMQLAHCIVHGHTTYDLGDTDAKRFAPVFNSLEHLMARAPEVLGTHYDIAYPGNQFLSARNIKTLPVHAQHTHDGAHFGQTGHWERPLYFGKRDEPRLSFGRPDWFDQVAAEVNAAHSGAALFDASCFGKFDISGSDAESVVATLCSGAVNRKTGSVSYNLMLNARGTIELDLTVQRLSDADYRLIVGTQVSRKASALIRAACAGADVQVTDSTDELALFSLSGPRAFDIARTLGASAVEALPYLSIAEDTLAGLPVTLARLSYVGESGVEITCASGDASAVHAALRAAGAHPAGLYAQTAMRIEKRFCAVGHELDSDMRPTELGLTFACRKHGGYRGADAVDAARGEPVRLRTLVFDDHTAVPIGHEPVYSGGSIVGQTSSAGFAHRVGAPIALALFHRGVEPPTTAEVDIAGSRFSAQVLNGAAFDPTGQRMREDIAP
ncbi:MAG: glycine cleavage T C-terminal barrel domain-containing protein, partial [Pseudomonadota bacterium]